MIADFPQPPVVVFDYLTDPRRRPQWQAGLRRVEDVRGTGEVGTTWRDVTVIGARPRMRVTGHEPRSHWAEAGSWGGLDATLTMGFTPHGPGTRVHVAVHVTARNRLRRPLAGVLMLAAPRAIRRDLARAARRLG